MKHVDPVELRGDVEREIIDFIDVVSTTRRQHRMELVEMILREWVESKVHESRVVTQLARSKGKAGE